MLIQSDYQYLVNVDVIYTINFSFVLLDVEPRPPGSSLYAKKTKNKTDVHNDSLKSGLGLIENCIHPYVHQRHKRKLMCNVLM